MSKNKTINIRCVTLQHGMSLDLNIEKEYIQETRVEMGVVTFVIAERITPFDLDEIMQGEVEFRKNEAEAAKSSLNDEQEHIQPRNEWEEGLDE